MSETGRGSSPASKANLAKGRAKGRGSDFKPAPKRNPPPKRTVEELREAAAKGGKASAEARRQREAVQDEVGHSFVEGDYLTGMNALVLEGGRSLAFAMQQERIHKNIDPVITGRIESIRKMINDAIKYREMLETETPIDAIGAEIARRLEMANFSPESPDGPPAEDAPDAEDADDEAA